MNSRWTFSARSTLIPSNIWWTVFRVMRFCLFAISCILMPFLKTDKRPYHYWKLFSQTNSSMTDLSVLYSKVNDLWLLYTSYIIIVLWSSLWPKHILSKPQNCFQNYFPGISFIFVICSSSQLCLAVYGVVIRSTASSKEKSPIYIFRHLNHWTFDPSLFFLLPSYFLHQRSVSIPSLPPPQLAFAPDNMI